jgi:ParB family chromosome partitioning protein
MARETEELFDALVALDGDSRRALFAHCVALSLNAIVEPWNTRPPATRTSLVAYSCGR